MSTTTNTDLRQAVSVIRDAVSGNRCSRTGAVATAHRIVIDQRRRTTGLVRDAIDTYLDPATWARGPFVLRDAIHQLSRQLDLTVPDEFDNVAEQLELFDSEPATHRPPTPARMSPRTKRAAPR